MKLCWNAIVKNEDGRIERCMRSLIQWIDSAVIVDTGSTDTTIEKIKTYLGAKNIPVIIKEVPFENFEQARNAALGLARVHRHELKWDYLLLVDADMELVVTDPRWRDQIKGAPSYEMYQHAGSTVYTNARLVSKEATGTYRGVTHEFLDVPSAGAITGAHFMDHADGANRKDKWVRDIKLLKEGLEKEPNFDRYWFYLAQSYRECGQWSQAADAYKKRVSMGGWDEEVYQAQLNYAHCLRNLGDTGGFVRECLLAYGMRPSRGEALYDLARYYREKGMNHVSLLFSEQGLKLPVPQDRLFVNADVHKWGFREEYSICSFYDESRRGSGFAVSDGLSLDPNIPDSVRGGAASNLYWYVPKLPELLGYFSAHRIPFTPPAQWTALNPSLIVEGDRVFVVVRTVNYVLTDEGYYMINGKDGRYHYDASNPIRTRNFLVELTKTLDYCQHAEIKAPESTPLFPLVIGFEDMRLFKWQGELWTSSTVREMNAEGWCEQVMARIFLPRVMDEDLQLVEIQRILPQERRNEKNWAPFVRGDRLQWLYRLGTLVDLDGTLHPDHVPSFRTDTISGGSQVVELPPGGVYITVVHEARTIPNQQHLRYYTHRFVTMDKAGKVLKMTVPFVINDKQIEFVAGLAIHPNQKQLLISYGVRDKEAWIAKVDIADVMGLLT